MLSQKQEKVICKNIFDAWTSQGKNYILWRKIVCYNGMQKWDFLEGFKKHLFQMSTVRYVTII